MKPRTTALSVLLAAASIGLSLLPNGAQAATPRAAWLLDLSPVPTAFAPATERHYELLATNVGAAPTSGPMQIEVSLPQGVSTVHASAGSSDPEAAAFPSCTFSAHLIDCQTAEVLHPGRLIEITIGVAVEATEGTLTAQARIEGGGALQAVTSNATATISAVPPSFDVFGLAAPAIDPEGLPATGAGSHPSQLSFAMDFPAAQFGTNELTGAGHLRDSFGELPRGYLVDPAATPVRCTEVELLRGEGDGSQGCPEESQVGVIAIANALAGVSSYAVVPSALYNMVPPPGSPASLGTDATESGIYVHLLSGVRTDSDFGLYGYSEDVLALATHPVLGAQLQLWGDPSSPSHDQIRGSGTGSCQRTGGSCSVPAQRAAFLTQPPACEVALPRFEGRADSWEQPGLFLTDTYSAADLAGNPAPSTGCNAEPFEPKISSTPTTGQADSPAGLEVDLHQPPDMDTEHISPAPLKEARVTLPEGLLANPSQADGLAGCTESQIGYLADDEEAGVHFSKAPQSCPDAAKLGRLEVSSPLLAQYTEEGTKLVTDPETGEAIPRPLKGFVYLANPYQNPFGTLLAIYLVIEDSQSGLVAKLAGRVEPDPNTGQLTTIFTESPELPLSDAKLDFFNGPRAPFSTPLVCGTHTTTTDLTPWSSPEGADAHPSSSFQITEEPGGGTCPTSESSAPNSPSLTAGTLSPQAGAYSPFVLKLHREDGSQRLTGLDATLPPGLSGKLAGIAECSDAEIAQAKGREHPNEGILERESPSCPASSEVGSVDVAAGAGPTPFHTQGHAYLAGPYKSAPLSLAVIVPAIAGPFDLGAVVNRVALHLDPETAQIHAVSDPFPTIIDGIPLDLRSLSLEMGRPNFTLNPTNCEEMQVLGTATSALGQIAPLTQRFQVGGCDQLPFKPKLSLALKGPTKRTSHPALIANLKAKPGEANIAKAQVKLPAAAFLDQAHIGTVCTRVQFAAKTCPAGSVYGKVSATTPLLDYPLTGLVYLRSSPIHELPDLLADLNGPSTQPIEIALAGKTDSVKGALRNTFEAVPDQPVTSFHLELFGGKRGLIILSSGLCKSPKATVNLDGQNGKVFDSRPVVGTSCPKQQKTHHPKHHRHH